MRDRKKSGLKAAQTCIGKWGKDYFSVIGTEGGRLGGKARVRKGFAALAPERRKEISRLGVEARQKCIANA